MAHCFPTHTLGLNYVRAFTEAHRSTGESDNAYAREIRCERVQFPAVLIDPRPGDWLAGKRMYPEVGYSLQNSGVGYYADWGAWKVAQERHPPSPAEQAHWAALREYWETADVARMTRRQYPAWVTERVPEPFGSASLQHPAYALCRVCGLQLDFAKLIRLGLGGLQNEIRRRAAAMPEAEPGVVAAMEAAVDRLECCVRHYRRRAAQYRTAAASGLVAALDEVLAGPPLSFHAALQLVLLTTTLTGTINFGRLDVTLGPALCRDLDSGRLTHEHALCLMKNFYRIVEEEIMHFDGRFTIGGVGRENEAEADRFALLAMETTEALDLPMPQVSLRFHPQQNPQLLEKAYAVIARGKTFPMLYNDAVNVPAVERAFGISRKIAEQYAPFGCGEYMIEHRSVDTPNSIINLLRCLESALNHGRCLSTGMVIGPDLGGLESYEDFETLWNAYARTCSYFVEALVVAHDIGYQVVVQEAPLSLVSVLYDDCLSRGKALLDGGVRILGGTIETYGNSNTADALGAIRALIYERRTCSGGELIAALRNDWHGREDLLAACLRAPKYGNDDDAADAITQRVHRHICELARSAAAATHLNHHLVVVINNNTNTVWGRSTSASPDGRHAGAPLAPGNAAGAGCDRAGLTAVLNSQAKLDPGIHAGAVQNVRLAAAFPKNTPDLYRTLFDVYFERGGAQAMITVTSRADLEAAMEHPQNYANLLVRVGGFSARFIDLDTATQQEILSRTEHG